MEDYSTASSKAENIPKMAAMPHWYRSTISEQKLTKKIEPRFLKKEFRRHKKPEKNTFSDFFCCIFFLRYVDEQSRASCDWP